jgi:two-component system, OmpR family, sensor histidine kinase BaeS
MSRVWRSLTVRLFTAQALVVLAGGATLGAVATTAGPAIFRAHLNQATRDVDAQTSRHVEQAYASANALSLGLALIAALAAALSVSAYLARRLGHSVGTLAQAAAQLADGHFATRATPPGLGQDFDTLTAAFNTMAGQLESVETTRRRMLADLGHEMRTPLATIEGYLDALDDGVSVPDEDAVTVLRTQAGRLRRLADDISAVSRAEELAVPLRREPVDVAQLISTVVAAGRARFAATAVELEYHCDDGISTVEGDTDQLVQVLTNLLDNALRHTPPGGRVTLTAQPTADGVEIIVADTGSGIAAEHLPHIFERFYRADTARDRDHGGSGIGLTIARGIITAHGGHITATSAGPGQGATFTVTLSATPLSATSWPA